MELPIETDIVLPVDPDEAWEALSDAEAWLADEAELDLTEGGAGRFVMPDGSERHAVVRELIDGERLGLWWWAVDADGIPVDPGREVVFELCPVEGGTRVSVTDTPVGVPQMLAHA